MKDLYVLIARSGYTEQDILSRRRQKDLVDARQVIAKELRAKGYSYPQIGKAMNRDHSGIIRLINRR